jgi:hypothetical protein
MVQSAARVDSPRLIALGFRTYSNCFWESIFSRDRHREVMAGRSWTELFFLDETIALSAGHRPCFLCRREAAIAFRGAWAAATGAEKPSAAAIDDALHGERLNHGRKLIHAVPAPLTELPDGAVIVASGAAYTVAGGRAFRWTERGYEPPQKIARADGLLTPPSTLKALQAGYRPIIHPTIESLIGPTPS